MGEYQLSLFLFVLFTPFCRGAGAGTCGDFSYYSRPNLNDKTFSQGSLQVLTLTSKYECFRKCRHHSECKMLLTNPSTAECQLYSTPFADSTYATLSPGLQYYAAGCRHAKSVNVTVPTCEAEFAPFPSSVPSQCYGNNLWVASQSTCKRVEWIDTTETSIHLPSPVVAGLEIDIRGAQKVDGDAGVVFDLRVVFTETQYQVTINGNAYATDTLYNPMEISTFIVMYNWDPLERVKLTYP